MTAAVTGGSPERLDWKEVLGSLNDGVVVTRPSSEIVWANDAYCSLTGYSLDELVGQTPAVLRSPQTRPEDIEALWDTLRTAGRAITRIVNRRADGTLFFAEVSISRVNDPLDGALFVSTMRDVTIEVENETRLERALSLAEAARDITIESLASLAEQRDHATGAHLLRIEGYVLLMARWVLERYADRLPEWARDASTLARCSILHDIGKVGIPDSVLLKAGPLTDDEQQVMREHPRLGAQILDRVLGHQPESSFLRVARDVIAYHHEAWDGRGYPYGLHGDAIPVTSQLVTVADVFDALTSKRPYKPAYGFDDAVAYVRGQAGVRLSPLAVEAFLANVGGVRDVYQRYGDESSGEPIRTSGIARGEVVTSMVPASDAAPADPRASLLNALREGEADADGGEVVVRAGATVGRVLFHERRIAWIALSTDGELFSDVLARDAGLEPDDLAAVVAECKRTGAEFTSALLRWGLVEREPLRELLRDFLARRLASLLSQAHPVALFAPSVRAFAGEFTFDATELGVPPADRPGVASGQAA